MRTHKRTKSEEDCQLLIKEMDREIESKQNKDIDESVALEMEYLDDAAPTLEIKHLAEKRDDRITHVGHKVELTEFMFYKLITRSSSSDALSCLEPYFSKDPKIKVVMSNDKIVRREYYTKKGKQIGTYYTTRRRCFVYVNPKQQEYINDRSCISNGITYPLV